MPNTEVKLSSAENTWMETSWEDREVLAFVYSPIAQSVERVTVNHDVVGSSPTGGAKLIYRRSILAGGILKNMGL